MLYGECQEADWRLFRQRVPMWQEAYMRKLLEKYKAILENNESASEKFWTLEEQICVDKRSPGAAIYNMRRSHMKDDLRHLLQCGVIALEDLEGFSQELQDDLIRYMNIEKNCESDMV